MITNLVRVFLGFVFFTAGMAKLFAGHKFPGLIGPVWLEDELARYNLGTYARFIAYSQVVIGFLLLTRRYATLGAVMLLPMIANILMVTISLGWRGTPYVNAVLLGMNLWLLWSERDKFGPLTGKSLAPGAFAFGMVLVLAAPTLSRLNLPAGWAAAAAGLVIAFASGRAGRAAC